MTTAPHPDLGAYFARIGWHGPTRPDYATLAGLLQAHMSSIPFENLDVLLGRRVALDLASIEAKLIRARRGGYCFEHATLFAAVLEALGFQVGRHLARVILIVPRELAPRTHMLLTVLLPEGRFVADPGFGSLAPPFPVPLVDAGPVAPDGITHWLARDGAGWVLRTRMRGAPTDVWVTAFEPENTTDFELGNHYTATHPASVFVNRLMLRACTPDGHVTVMNRDVTRWTGPEPVTSVLADRRALRQLLAEVFGIDLPEAESLRVPAIPEWD